MAPRKNKFKVNAPRDAATDSTGRKLGFLDIPAELRTQIYGYLLEEKKPVRLEIRGHRKGKAGEFRQVVRCGAADEKHRRREYDRSKRKWIQLPMKHTSILYVNKQIYLEAEPVLYGNNILVFERTTVLKEFLDTIGKRAQHLCHIRIASGGYVKSSARQAFKALAAAGGLRKLELGHLEMCKGRSYSHAQLQITEIANDCKALAKSLQDSYQQRGVMGDIPNVFGFYLGPCTACAMAYDGFPLPGHLRGVGAFNSWNWSGRNCSCECRKALENNDHFTKVLRDSIAQHLKPAANANQRVCQSKKVPGRSSMDVASTKTGKTESLAYTLEDM